MFNGVAFLFVKNVLDFWYSGYFLFLAVGKLNSENSKKTKRLNKDEIKRQLIESITIDNVVEMEDLNELAEKVQKPKEVADVMKQYEDILRTKRKGMVSVMYYQGEIFKRFKEKQKFLQMVSKLKIHKSAIIFKINIFKIIEKHPGLMKLSVTLNFLKNYLKDIKKICQENSSEFELVKVICLKKLH